ncbi:hypothetical protein V8D89_005790 [Ganoderma adspersum]
MSAHSLDKGHDSRVPDVETEAAARHTGDEQFGGTEARKKLERKLLRKLDARMSILIVIYILNYIDRNNASAARLRGFEDDLHLKGQEFNTLLSILYVGYIIMQIPSNMFLNYIGKPSLYLPVCMVVWGMISTLTGITTNFTGALLTRFFLGFVEAAFFPGALFLLSKWYKRSELGVRTAVLSCGSLISNAFGSLIASGILDGMEGKLGHSAWRWLFFIEGALTMFVAILAIFILPDFPDTSHNWLSPEEVRLAEKRMEEDVGVGDGVETESGGRFHGLKLALADWKVWWLGVALTSMVISLSFNAFFPTLSATMGYNPTITLLLCAPPWVFGTIVAFLACRHSDRTRERFWHIAIPLAFGIVGFVMAASTMVLAARYVALFLMAQSYAGFIIFLAWISNTIARPPSKRAVALAFINSFAQLGNISGSYVWPKPWGPSYRNSYAICIATNGLCIVMELHDGWTFTQVGGSEVVKDGEWLPVRNFPTTVHVELLEHKKIPDPFVGLHEWDVQWIGEVDWAFKTSLTASEAEVAAENVDLVFDGLDTFAVVELNGRKILETENQFIGHRVPVKQYLQAGENTLLLTFSSAFRKGREIEEKHGKLNLWNGDSSRLHVRKAQYNYGWDWGPVLMTVGPWKAIRLETYTTRIVDLDVRPRVDEKLCAAVDITFELSKSDRSIATVSVNGPDGKLVIGQTDLVIQSERAEAHFKLSPGAFDLWFPVGYGKQPIYTVEIKITDKDGHLLDSKSQKFAFRRTVIVQDELEGQEGRSFLFEINNIRIFCGGSNWIPSDSFLTRLTAERYRQWLQLLVDGNQNMIRIWGGGIYEADAFYDICDELGILVWQDFMFGCGQYPAYDSFTKSVELEAEQNVKRLRHHPSIAIFDYQLAESCKLQLDYSDEKSDFRDTDFPARYIYERLLPSVVGRLTDIHYHRSSPYSGFGKVTTDKNYGDLHQWNVWHGSQEPWHNWDILAGRFVSEFGMQGYPNIRTVDYWLGGDKAERHPQSRTNCNHNKADGFERRIELYLVENFKHAFDIESYVYYTQIMQAETLASAYRLWRRNWKGRGKEYTAGALVWQINDCWPVTSWAIVDYFLRPKPAYYAIKRELRPYTVGMTRKEHKKFADGRSAAFFTIDTVLDVWGTNSTLDAKKATLEVTAFDLHSPDWRERFTQDVTLAPNAATELWSGTLPGQPQRTKAGEVPNTIIVSARLLDIDDGSVLGRYSNWPEPFKYVHFPPPAELGFAATVGADGASVTLSAKRPIKGIILDVDGEQDAQWSDQAIDLVPDDPQTVVVQGLGDRTVRARFLGDGSA